MILISHRGNIDCHQSWNENHPEYIQAAIDAKYDVEMDVRLIGNELFLGHDTPDYLVSLDWLVERRDHLWVHCKNFAALSYLIDHNLRIFYHQKENHTIINNSNLIWSHDLSEANEKSIIPLLSLEDIAKFKGTHVAGICSDYVATLGFK
jgi:hypothetical protein